MLADLAGIVTEFVEPRRHTEILEHRTSVVTRTGRRRSTVIREAFATWQPSYLAGLHLAAYPGSGELTPTGGFESQSPANDAAIDALRVITGQVTGWCWRFRISVDGEKARMRRLVGARHTDTQLTDLLEDAQGWRQTARVAIGEELPLRTINQPCPDCLHRNVLTMRADGTYVRCAGCGRVWDESMVGLLAAMLAANRTHETLSIVASA